MRALIVLGGDAPGEALLRAQAAQADLTIAADKGLEAFMRCRLMPDAVLGDMDSVRPDVLRAFEAGGGRARILPTVKDDTDGVAALALALERGADDIVFLGALGGRLDHALGNCMLLVRAANRGARACLLSERERVLLIRGRQEIRGHAGDTLSLLSLGKATIHSLEGLFYPLHEYEMTCDYPIGISNVFTQETAVVHVSKGDVLCFLPACGEGGCGL